MTLLLSLLLACDPGPVGAPQSMVVTWEGEETATQINYVPNPEILALGDNQGFLFVRNVYVYAEPLVGAGQQAGAPLLEELPANGIQVEISSGYFGLGLLPETAVRVVDYPALPSGIETGADIREACTDDNGNYTNAEEWCAWHWDAGTGQFFQFGVDYADGNGYLPGFMIAETDKRGVVPVYMWLDGIPSGGGDFDVVASIGHDISALSFTMTAPEE